MAKRKPPPKAATPKRRASNTRFDVLALGASAGGEAAIMAILSELPRDFPIPIIIMQHLHPTSTATATYARRLPFAVEWVDAGSKLTAGTVLLCRPRSFVEVLPDGTCALSPCEGGANERPIDALFDSIARSFGARSIGVILSGMGKDGAVGARQLHLAGGTVLVQTEASAEYPSMPRAAIQAGAAEFVVPVEDLGPLIADLVAGTPRPRPRSEMEAISRVFGEKGEVATRAREIDWAKTPLGPVVGWPAHLGMVARMVLQSAYPMALWWGPELVQIYNE